MCRFFGNFEAPLATDTGDDSCDVAIIEEWTQRHRKRRVEWEFLPDNYKPKLPDQEPGSGKVAAIARISPGLAFLGEWCHGRKAAQRSAAKRAIETCPVSFTI